MKKIILLISALSLVIYCGPKQEEVERIMEDGVEVVINHLEPYKIIGEPSTLHLEEEFTIDTERDEIAELGLTEIWGFGVDSELSIYLYKPPMAQEDLVFKFDKDGNFQCSFATKGQGPGEIEFPSFQKVDFKDEIPILDTTGSTLFTYDKNCSLIKEFPLGKDIGRSSSVFPLENGYYLVRSVLLDPSERHIFIGNSERGYEIWVYDLEGNLRRKIRKDYRPEEVPEEYKKKISGLLEQVEFSFLKNKVYFPKHWPSFQFLFTDDEGRLFVMTHEKGEKPKEYVFDIFNSEDIFIGRKSLEVFLSSNLFAPGSPIDSWAVMKKNRFYCIQEKESGYKKLVVYKMKWEYGRSDISK